MDAVTPPVYDSQRGKALLDIFRQGPDLVSQRQTARTLGHREAYLGMSELARFTECPRAAVAAKLYPAPANLPRLLTLQRGHWFEQGVAESLAGLGIHAPTQLLNIYFTINMQTSAYINIIKSIYVYKVIFIF